MRNFLHYLAESARDHRYVIKFAQSPTEEQIEIIEAWLKRYDLREISKPTLIEHDRKDFIDVPNKQVYAMKISLGTPVSQYVLLQDLKIASNISEKFMVVRSENEPIERYAQHDLWSRLENEAAAKAGEAHAARLSTDREYLEAEQPQTDPLFGDQYNQKLLSYLAGVAENRPTHKVEPAAPLFSWLQLEDVQPGEPRQDTADFNAYIDTPKPVSKGTDTTPVDKKFTNSKGTMSDDSIPTVKFFKDPKTGKAKQVVQPMEKN